MRFFISADIEGVTGINNWSETNKGNPEYAEFRTQMTREVVAACEGALAAGAREVVVKDAHDSGRNLKAEDLPREVKLIRNWAGHPYSMVWGIDQGFDAVGFVGYHSPSGSNDNPLAHTMSSRAIMEMTLNGELCSEFLLHALVARTHHVVPVFLSGDAGICERATNFDPQIETVATFEGTGQATLSIHPLLAIEQIKEGVEKALKKKKEAFSMAVPEQFILEITYKKHQDAYRASHYPGAKILGAHSIRFETNNMTDVMRFIMFCV